MTNDTMRDKMAGIISNNAGYHIDGREDKIADAIIAALPDHVRWAAEQWHMEVANRPLINIHRRTLDDTWRKVIKHHGGDDVFLCGPKHDDLVEAKP